MTTLLLARLHERPDNLRGAVEAAVAGLQAVLQRTVEAAGDAARSKAGTPEVRGVGFCFILCLGERQRRPLQSVTCLGFWRTT